ncbi:sensor histidine kinase [Salimicrobium flavidum]|uniref:Heme sensor protein HssS n=1 Tax=Salimicrobium flavidum TaxID=570947 RepID=A0A1N7JA25_9BACI|nr:HAMP domain-containing sensor histidine kinase [Salimicrobium flavidum]SIS46202.1 Signal transduction histidine kinase [Salimicrobium flavidum]
MKSLYTKFLIITLTIMTLSSLIGFLISNIYYQNNLKLETDQKNTEIARSIASYAETTEEPNIYLSHTADTGYQLYLAGPGSSRFFGESFDENTLPKNTVEQVRNGDTYHGMENFPGEIFVTGFFANELKNSVGVPLTLDGEQYALFLRPDIKLLFNEIHILLGQMVGIIITVSLLAMLAWSGMLILPIRKLSRATMEIQEGSFHVRPDIQRKDEIGQLARNFNSMIGRLSEVDRLRRTFVTNVSHDIQTPLANIRGYSYSLEKNQLEEEEKKEHIRIIQEEAEHLSILSRQLLLLSSIENKDGHLPRETFDLRDQLTYLLHRYHWRINESGLALTYSLEEGGYAGSEDLLYTVWENLLSNAIKYSTPGGTISVSLENAEKGVTVTVKDEGIGMSTEETSRVFERFYRADPARSRTTEGTGLGLAIVKEVVDLHQGEVSIHSSPGEGTTFVVFLPHL